MRFFSAGVTISQKMADIMAPEWLDNIYDCKLGWSLDKPSRLDFMGFVIDLAKLKIVKPKDLPNYKQHRVLELFTKVLNHQLSEGRIVINLKPFDVSARTVFSLRQIAGNYVYSVMVNGESQGLAKYICIPRDKIHEFAEHNIDTVVPDIAANPEEYIHHVALKAAIRDHKAFKDCDRLEVVIHALETTDTPASENSTRIVKQVLTFDFVCWGPNCVFGTRETKTAAYKNGCGPGSIGSIFNYFTCEYKPMTFRRQTRLWSSTRPNDWTWASYIHFVDAQTKQIVSDDYKGSVEFMFHHPRSSIKAAAQ